MGRSVLVFVLCQCRPCSALSIFIGLTLCSPLPTALFPATTGLGPCLCLPYCLLLPASLFTSTSPSLGNPLALLSSLAIWLFATTRLCCLVLLSLHFCLSYHRPCSFALTRSLCSVLSSLCCWWWFCSSPLLVPLSVITILTLYRRKLQSLISVASPTLSQWLTFVLLSLTFVFFVATGNLVLCHWWPSSLPLTVLVYDVGTWGLMLQWSGSSILVYHQPKVFCWP